MSTTVRLDEPSASFGHCITVASPWPMGRAYIHVEVRIGRINCVLGLCHHWQEKEGEGDREECHFPASQSGEECCRFSR